MQLKNNNMEKRTDLASLFCTIGRHGPAVAVAVIAMVSVVAGFIIYRTVKGKRRKAEAGPGHGGSSSPGTLRDASLPQPEEELSPEYEARSREESTDMSEDVLNAWDADATRSLCKLRNRHTVAEKNPQSSSPSKREVGPEELCGASHMDKISSIPLTNAEEAIKSFQDDMCELKDLNVECKDYKCDLVTPKDSEADHMISVEPVVVRESLGKKVQGLQEGEVATEDVSKEMPCREEANLCGLNGPVCREGKTPISLNENDEKNCQAVSASDTEGYFEEPTIHMHESPLCTKNEDKISVLDTSGFNKPHPANEDFNMTLHKQVDDQLITVTNVTMPAIHGADAEQSPNGEVAENKLTNLGDLSVNHAVLPSSKEPELEQDSSTCSKENIENVKQSSFGERQETSALVLSPGLPCLSVEPETIQDDQALTLVGLQSEYIMKEVTTELAKETSGALFELCRACPQSEIDETINILIPKENVEILLSLADGEPNAVVSDEFSPAASVSTEMSCPDESSFQNQESEQVQNMEDLLEVPTAPAPVMAESIEPQVGKDQLLSENQSKLTSCSSDVEESGISGMKVVPDLCDAGECPLTPENMWLAAVDDHLQSQDQAELQTTMADLQSVIKEEPVDAVPLSLNDSQPHIEETDKANDDCCTVNEVCHETEGFSRAVGQLSNDAPTVCLSEDLRMMDTKIIIIEGKEEDKTTEINIMEAIMDNNEWITDGTDQVPPQMKTSVPQINPVSLEENIQTSFPVDAACTNADVPTANESEEANTVPPIDGPTETGKRVLAVQPMPQSVSVTFRIHYLTHSPYQKVAITGNHWELGNWKDFVPLEKAKDGLWATVVSLPAESYVEWKFVVVDRGQVCRWEECDNRFLDTGNSENLLVHKCWGFL
ncbi:hypothetical protein CRENBAI_019353 [Crenichthys baileyi]|uniref:Starch-binding domain-containing protein 1 n=1 Tax=Crenichthys baileyi TaxID=28760 RepID=A0AAV9R630_9TELE